MDRQKHVVLIYLYLPLIHYSQLDITILVSKPTIPIYFQNLFMDGEDDRITKEIWRIGVLRVSYSLELQWSPDYLWNI